jgi:benzoyl-CoA reductase/2-hydroxyglutaryl-CoA dehydratase subunit BcrC/BadD/HgdB
MRHAHDWSVQTATVPTILIHMPTTWQSTGARKLYREELNRLSRFLCALGGTRPTQQHLARVMSAYDLQRRNLRQLAQRLTPHQFTKVLIHFERTGEVSASDAVPPTGPRHGLVPVALIGGPRRAEDKTVFHRIEDGGGYVALDATEWGPRALCRAFDDRSLADEPFRELADAYFDTIPDITRRPNDGFYQWLTRQLQACPVRGMVVLRYLWCDLWHAEVERLRQRFDLPVLDLDLDGEAPLDTQRVRTRVSAFMEMLA